MTTVHVSEAEVARDLHAVLDKVQRGVEIVVEQDHRPVAIIRPAPPKGRLLSSASRLEAGETIDEFLEGFPTVAREQVIAFLEEAKTRTLAGNE